MNMINKQISVLYRLSQTYISKKLKTYQLSHSQIVALLFISKNSNVSQRMICDDQGLDKGSVSSMITKLIGKGFISRRRNPYDRRGFVLELTYKSTLLLSQVEDASNRLSSGILEGFDTQEREAIYEYLSRMKDNIELLGTKEAVLNNF
jgi:DNA-binding MarR family transcriptional regulator